MEVVETIDIFDETPKGSGDSAYFRVMATSFASAPLTAAVPSDFQFRNAEIPAENEEYCEILERTSTRSTQEVRAANGNVSRNTPPVKRNLFAVSPVKNISRKRTNEEPIKTIVFCDFETSGLFPNSNDLNKAIHLKQSRCPSDFVTELEKTILETQRDQYPRILELSFIAVPRETFEKSAKKMADNHAQGEQKLIVRVPCNITTRQINPHMNEIEWQQYEQKRNSKENPLAYLAMVHEKNDLNLNNTFDVEWKQVRQFLDSCPKPVCLVAHNGLKFDYKVLHGELARYNLLGSQPLPQGILFVDSLLAIQNIEQTMKRRLCETLRSIDWKMISQLLITDEVTPNPRDNPLQFLNRNEWPTALFKRYNAADFKKSETGQWEFTPEIKRYSLPLLYESILGETAYFHYAQDDSQALLQICLAYGHEFLGYMDTAAAEMPF